MDNRVVNKQISIIQIIEVAKYLLEYKGAYDEKFEIEESRNKDLPYNEKNYEYEYGMTKLQYTVSLKEGKSLTEDDFNWFVDELSQTDKIKNISLCLSISFETKDSNNKEIRNRIYASVDFSENEARISIDTTNQENEAHRIYSEILRRLEENDDRYNKTIKNRNIRIQSFCISAGLILSYILYITLKINETKLLNIFIGALNNKYVIIIGQWITALVLGNIFSSWIINMIYKPLLPGKKYVGYNSDTYESIYKDDVEDYKSYSEVHFGKYADAEKRRNMIEEIFNVTNKILLFQLIISFILFLILR